MAWSRFFRRRHWDRERSREIQAHVEIETAENVARGMAPEEARHAALRKLGNPERIREEIYGMNTLGFLEALWQDLRHAMRLLWMNPAFAAVAIASLALGIGANTAIFQLLDAVRLRTLPVKNPQELAEVKIQDWNWSCCSIDGRNVQLTNAIWEDIRDHQQAFSSMLAWGTTSFNLARSGEARVTEGGLWVSGDFFNALGVQPIVGRVFTPADDRRGCGGSAVISHGFWQREFGGNPSAVGSKLTLEGHPFEVIGVTPASFFGVEVGRFYDVALPICAEPIISGEDAKLDLSERSKLNRRSAWWLAAMGRLKPGWTLARASAHLRTISPGIMQATLPEFDTRGTKKYLAFKLAAFPAGAGSSELRETYATPLWLLLALSASVLLIACANLANLMLARASARQREIAIRLAIGASRGRLIRQLLSESALLAALGAIAGACLARMLSQVLVSFLSTPTAPVFVDLTLDWRMLAFTTALSALTCVLFGLTPAIQATRAAPGSAMKPGGRGVTEGVERFGFRRALVVFQIALSLALLTGGLLFVRTLRNLSILDAGFRQEGMVEADVDLTRLKTTVASRSALIDEVLGRLRAIPGVESGAVANIVPIGGDSWNQYFWTVGREEDVRRESLFNRVDAGYFRTMGTPLLAGRDFGQLDTPESPVSVIVNEAFARKFLGGASPLGATLRFGPASKARNLGRIVGLVAATKYNDLREDFPPIIYLARSQEKDRGEYAHVLMRCAVPPGAVQSAVKLALAGINPDIGFGFHVLRIQIQESLLRERLMATLSAFFAALAGALTAIGLYGVISYMVSRRTNEIGIRMALGAGRAGIMRMILRESAILLAVGLALGAALSLATERAASTLLFGLRPHDPTSLALAAGGLAAVTLIASYLPARRAAGLDPMSALREE